MHPARPSFHLLSSSFHKRTNELLKLLKRVRERKVNAGRHPARPSSFFSHVESETKSLQTSKPRSEEKGEESGEILLNPPSPSLLGHVIG